MLVTQAAHAADLLHESAAHVSTAFGLSPFVSCWLQANSKGSNQGCPKPQDANQAVYGKGEPADAVKLQHQLQKEQERVRALEGRLKDANRASEYHRVVRAVHAEQPATGVLRCAA